MKTKELKKIVNNNRYTFEKDLISVFVKNEGELVMKMVSDGSIILGQNYILFSKGIKTVMKALIEYSETPIEEREEEKKYLLQLPDCFFDKYLNFNDGEYFFGSEHNDEEYKTHFTKNDIFGLPTDIQRAITCGFLKKVEVEE